MARVAFAGFEPQVVEFWRGLTANTNQDWFTAHGAEYEAVLQ